MRAAETLRQIRTGMVVHTADGHTLGKVRAIGYGTDATPAAPRWNETVCSRLEGYHGLVRRYVLYIPCNAIATVSGKAVTLTVDAATVHDQPWHARPNWIAREKALMLPSASSPGPGPGGGFGGPSVG